VEWRGRRPASIIHHCFHLTHNTHTQQQYWQIIVHRRVDNDFLFVAAIMTGQKSRPNTMLAVDNEWTIISGLLAAPVETNIDREGGMHEVVVATFLPSSSAHHGCKRTAVGWHSSRLHKRQKMSSFALLLSSVIDGRSSGDTRAPFPVQEAALSFRPVTFVRSVPQSQGMNPCPAAFFAGKK
jgi:hypothetical protein